MLNNGNGNNSNNDKNNSEIQSENGNIVKAKQSKIKQNQTKLNGKKDNNNSNKNKYMWNKIGPNECDWTKEIQIKRKTMWTTIITSNGLHENSVRKNTCAKSLHNPSISTGCLEI